MEGQQNIRAPLKFVFDSTTDKKQIEEITRVFLAPSAVPQHFQGVEQWFEPVSISHERAGNPQFSY
jgi:hypothetical protein